jgi:hypothetical protein
MKIPSVRLPSPASSHRASLYHSNFINPSTTLRAMASKTAKQSLSHLERTAAEPRDEVNISCLHSSNLN